MKEMSLNPMKEKLRPEGQKRRHLCADFFGLSRQENSLLLLSARAPTQGPSKERRPPTQEPSRAKRSGERRWGSSCGLALVLVCVCLSSCPCLGSPGPCWCGVCRVRCLVSCCFRGASCFVGAVPKTGHCGSWFLLLLQSFIHVVSSADPLGLRALFERTFQ